MFEFRYKETALVSPELLTRAAQGLIPSIETLRGVVDAGTYEKLEGSINLSTDRELLAHVRGAYKKKVSTALKYILVIGIGGSNLGTKAVYDALHGYFDLLAGKRFPKLIFLDTNDPNYANHITSFLSFDIRSPEELLVCVISKSGGTTETIANAEFVIHLLQSRFTRVLDRFVTITDFGSPLWIASEQKGIATLAIPDSVGGRYSVFSAVGLFPLLAAGFDIDALRRGAETMRQHCISTTIQSNPAALSALLLYLHYQERKTIHNIFLFHPELESLGKWYRQLVGESVGKEQDVDGALVHAGITPVVSIGSTDLHSVGQLYLGGPRNAFTTFVWGRGVLSTAAVPREVTFPGLVSGIAGKSMEHIMDAILEGVKVAYKKNKLPFAELVVSEISPMMLGGFMQMKMIEVMFLGILLNVNSFDQPNVESYKVETKKILGSY
ncbi:MAG: hypothetical protein COU08_03970 [Candidatus Harrisonbacteria bacterium CG10_big_fil_rev_8_21_14_0_10_42_17]|uniref:Glucose-6-phosphate isomerase n=1 Tax=Candidatus Harrisonbacteria bacterium CG10_big_fil_rev_8_21_14_0_10_42_17 TaxID=1974584 RepID=A0A2M6WH66_9BACT|nr:MAG: hypothetical protein COU08_03970 [Candidatus Harrisonbacteria bacterium CG10_big_fil_rev_8_21_14_0_10_42_17]